MKKKSKALVVKKKVARRVRVQRIPQFLVCLLCAVVKFMRFPVVASWHTGICRTCGNHTEVTQSYVLLDSPRFYRPQEMAI